MTDRLNIFDFNRVFPRPVGENLPPITAISGGVLTRVGSTVTWSPWTYSVAGLDTNTVTFVIDDVAQAPGVPTFPYTLAEGSTIYATGSATKSGYAPASPVSATVTRPAPNDITPTEWTYGEFEPTNAAILSTDTRKTRIATAKAPSPGKEWRFYRGANPLGDLATLGPMPFNATSGQYEGTSGGQNARGATVYCLIAETDTGGATGRRWATAVQNYQASGNPTIPTGVIIQTGIGAGNIDINVDAGDAQRRPISGLWAVVNGGTPFALSPAGGGAGVRTFNQAGTAAVDVQVFWRNANGDSPLTTAVSVTPGVATAAITTTSLSSFVFDGEAFTLAAAAPVGVYYGDEPFVLTTAPISVTAMGTPSALVDGTMAHGAMPNPYFQNDNEQGLDHLIGTTTRGEAIPYLAALNIDPTAAAAPYAIAANTEVTVVKTKRVPGAVAASWQKVEKYLPVTFLPASKAPQVGDFRPAMCSVDKTARLNISTLDFGCCRSLDISGMGFPTVAVALARWRKAMPFFGRGGEALRTLQVLAHVDGTNYSAQYAEGLIGDLGALFHASTTTAADRLAMAAAIAPVAIDIAAQVDRGFLGGAGAGQHEFYHPVLMWAAALFNSTYMYNAAQTIRSNLDQVYWIEEARQLGTQTDWPFRNEGGEFQYVVPFGPQEMNKPVWGGSDGGFPQNRGHGSQLNRTYGNNGGSGHARADQWAPVMFILANRSMPSGPDMVKGGAGVPENNTFSANSHRSAMIHYIDRELKIYPFNDIGASTRTSAFWAAHRGLLPVAPKVFVPDTIYNPAFTAGVNAVSWNYSALISGNSFSSTPITAQHLYVSQDNIQFVKVPAVPATGSQAIPGGIPHWCAIALENAQGEGRRSYTFKNDSADVQDRGYVVPTGTPTGAVTCTTLPALMRRELPGNTNVPWFVPVVGTIPIGEQLGVSSGFWTGALSGAATTVVQREATLNAEDWADIPGSTNVAVYTPVIADTGHRLRAVATRNGVTVSGAPVTMGTIPAIPAGTIINTEFGPDFQLLYPAFWASLVAESSAAPVHEPYRDWTLGSATSDGGVRGIKTTAWPRSSVQMTGLVIGQRYRVICHIPVEADGVQRAAAGIFRLATTQFGFDYYTTTVPYNAATGAQPTLFVVDTTFVATTDTLWLFSNVNSGAAGTAGGNPAMSKLSIMVD